MSQVAVRMPGIAVDRDRPAPPATTALVRGAHHGAPWWASPVTLVLADVAAAALVAGLVAWLVLGVPALDLALLVGCWGAFMASGRAAEQSLIETRAVVCTRVLRAAGFLVIAGAGLSLISPDPARAGDVFTLAALWAACSCTLRIVFPQLGVGCSRSRLPLLVVGAETEHRTRAVEALERRLGARVPVIQVSCDDDATEALHEVAERAAGLHVGAVIAIPGEGLDAAALRRLRWELESTHLPFFVDPGVLGVASTRLEPSAIGGLALVRIQDTHRTGAAWHLIGVAGRLAAALGLLLLGPFLLVIAFAITRTSAGPAIYRQVRVGQGGRAFTIFKFRTMTTGVCAAAVENDFDDVLFKMRTDPRITPLGRWLRRYSIDELPQLANVVLGQMRLIGPRPALPDEVARYADDDRRRLAVKPGLTGLWQVSGRSDLNWEETVRLDLHYVDNWSAGLDLVILCRTVGAVVSHHGAY